MSLLVILVLWAVLGGSVYRAHKKARSVTEHPTTGDGPVRPARRSERAHIPETVPSEWIEAYRAEQGG